MTENSDHQEIKDRLVAVEASVNDLSSYITNHLSPLPAVVARVKGRLDVLIPLVIGILGLLITVLVTLLS